VRRFAWWLHRHARQLALALGISAIAGALALHGLVVRPLSQRVEASQAQRKPPRDGLIERLDGELARSGESAPSAQLAAFYRHFADGVPLAERLARLHRIASGMGLEIKRADYRLSSRAEHKLDRYQMVLPVEGSYPRLRAFIDAALRDMPTLSLDSVTLQRPDAAAGTVQAQVTFTFFMAR
jgi:hypothetical protein